MPAFNSPIQASDSLLPKSELFRPAPRNSISLFDKLPNSNSCAAHESIITGFFYKPLKKHQPFKIKTDVFVYVMLLVYSYYLFKVSIAIIND